MLNIISQHADQSRMESKFAAENQLAKFAYEFCAEFKTVVGEHTHARKLMVETHEGVPIAVIGVDKDGGDTFFTYRSDNVTKQRGSGRSDSMTRDSSSISSLIRVIKKKNEQPTLESMLKSLGSPIKYALGAIGAREEPRVSMATDHAIALFEHVLIDKHLSPDYIQFFQERYAEYLRDMKSHNEAEKHAERFRKGFTFVSLQGDINRATHYLVGSAVANSDHVMKLQGGVKRYNSLYESPLAPTVAIIAAHFSAKDTHRNDFKMPRADKYYEDIDVASGYMGDGFVVLIPNEAP